MHFEIEVGENDSVKAEKIDEMQKLVNLIIEDYKINKI